MSLSENQNLDKNQAKSLYIKTAKRFNDDFSKNYDIRVIYDADQLDLFNALNDEKNMGVFWLSHSNSVNTLSGDYINGQITDAKGRDVQNIFKSYHKKLKWLSIIGCSNYSFFDSLLQEGIFNKNKVALYDLASNNYNNQFEGLTKDFNGLIVSANSKLSIGWSNSTFSFLGKLFRDDVNESFIRGKQYLDSFKDKEIEEIEQREVSSHPYKWSFSITRFNDFAEQKESQEKNNYIQQYYDSSQLVIEGKVVYVFPPTQLQVDKEATYNIEFETDSKLEDTYIVIQSGYLNHNDDRPKSKIGQFQIKVKERPNLKWVPFTIGGKIVSTDYLTYYAQEED